MQQRGSDVTSGGAELAALDGFWHANPWGLAPDDVLDGVRFIDVTRNDDGLHEPYCDAGFWSSSLPTFNVGAATWLAEVASCCAGWDRVTSMETAGPANLSLFAQAEQLQRAAVTLSHASRGGMLLLRVRRAADVAAQLRHVHMRAYRHNRPAERQADGQIRQAHEDAVVGAAAALDAALSRDRSAFARVLQLAAADSATVRQWHDLLDEDEYHEQRRALLEFAEPGSAELFEHDPKGTLDLVDDGGMLAATVDRHTARHTACQTAGQAGGHRLVVTEAGDRWASLVMALRYGAAAMADVYGSLALLPDHMVAAYTRMSGTEGDVGLAPRAGRRFGAGFDVVAAPGWLSRLAQVRPSVADELVAAATPVIVAGGRRGPLRLALDSSDSVERARQADAAMRAAAGALDIHVAEGP